MRVRFKDDDPIPVWEAYLQAFFLYGWNEGDLLKRAADLGHPFEKFDSLTTDRSKNQGRSMFLHFFL